MKTIMVLMNVILISHNWLLTNGVLPHMLILISSFLIIIFLFVFFGMGTNDISNFIKIYKPVKSVGIGVLTGILIGVSIVLLVT